MKNAIKRVQSQARLNYAKRSILHKEKRLRLGALLHFLIAIGHIGCLFALDEAFEAYGIREIMYQMVSGHVWMLYALTHRSCCRFLPGRAL